MNENGGRFEVPDQAPVPVTEQSRSIVPAALAAVAAAVAGGIAWGLIVKWSDYEIGIVAWGIGLLVGYAVAKASRGARGPALQGIAVAGALVGILLGKYLTYAFIVQEDAEAAGVDVGLFSGEMRSFFRDDLDVVFGLFDLLWVGLAVYTAWRALRPEEPEATPEV